MYSQDCGSEERHLYADLRKGVRRSISLIRIVVEYVIAWQLLYHGSPWFNQLEFSGLRAAYEELRNEYELKAQQYAKHTHSAPATSVALPDRLPAPVRREQQVVIPGIPSCKLRATVVKTAVSYQGTPYRFGGRDRSGIDCSALVQNAYRNAGIDLPRTAALQYQKGTFIPQEKLQPGDLVFFQTTRPGASHVGIYVGSGDFIHATSSGRVKYNGLSDTYYSTRFIGAKKIVG